jgi:rRNA biogenesis protein RRP5
MEEARTEAEAEFEKEERRGRKKKNASVSLGVDGDDDLGTLFGGATTGKLPRFANRITLKVLTRSNSLLLIRI